MSIYFYKVYKKPVKGARLANQISISQNDILHKSVIFENRDLNLRSSDFQAL